MAPPADLAAILRDALRGDGEAVLDDRARLGTLLRERAPGEPRAIHLLLTALDAGVPMRLRPGEGETSDGEIGQETSQLVDQFGVAADLARRTVETWAVALGRLPGAGAEGAKAPEPSAERSHSTEQRQADDRPEVASRSTQDGTSSKTPAVQAPHDDGDARDEGVVLPSLPPLPTGTVGHQDPTLATPGSVVRMEANADARPILPRPPDLPVPSPPSTGPVARHAEGGAPPVTELPPVRALPPVQPLPPVGALPPVQALPSARPPSAASPRSDVQPLPPVRPLPSAAPSVESLPSVRPLPADGAASPLQPLPGAQAASPPSPVPKTRPGWIVWTGAVAALALAGLGLLAFLGDKPEAPPTKPVDPPPRTAQGPETPQNPQAPQPPRIPQGPAQTGGQTAEGFPIVDAQTEPDVQGRRLEGDPNTLLFAFGLRFGQESYTYQAAVDFTRGDANGSGLVKVFKAGRESATGELRTSRSIQSNGYLGFTMSGPMRGDVSAPDVCVSALVGRTPGRFDLANGGGLFCAFATKAGGVCDGDVKIGCGKLVP